MSNLNAYEACPSSLNQVVTINDKICKFRGKRKAESWPLN